MSPRSEGGASAPARTVRRRALAVLIGLAAAGGILAAWYALRAPALPELDRERLRALLLERSRTPADAAPADAHENPWWIPEADAALLFTVSTRGQRYDPWTYCEPLPSQDFDVTWPEHAGGHFRYRTNALGLREDAEVASARPGLRVLVTGDSHAAGFCDNAESFANVLEARLARRFADRTVDVVNAANMGFSFQNYAGVLAKHRALRPHVFVVVVHGGNDFHEALLPYRYLHRLPPPPEDDALLARRRDAESRFPGALFQGAWSIASFRAHPAERAVAQSAADEALARIRAICAEDGIALVVVLLPSPLEVEPEPHAADVAPVLAQFGLTDADVRAHGAMGRDLLRRLTAAGMHCADATDALREAGEPSFWRADLHLSVAGHERVARLLEPLVVTAGGLER